LILVKTLLGVPSVLLREQKHNTVQTPQLSLCPPTPEDGSLCIIPLFFLLYSPSQHPSHGNFILTPTFDIGKYHLFLWFPTWPSLPHRPAQNLFPHEVF
jgi:hypothetical protein